VLHRDGGTTPQDLLSAALQYNNRMRVTRLISGPEAETADGCQGRSSEKPKLKLASGLPPVSLEALLIHNHHGGTSNVAALYIPVHSKSAQIFLTICSCMKALCKHTWVRFSAGAWQVHDAMHGPGSVWFGINCHLGRASDMAALCILVPSMFIVLRIFFCLEPLCFGACFGHALGRAHVWGPASCSTPVCGCKRSRALTRAHAILVLPKILCNSSYRVIQPRPAWVCSAVLVALVGSHVEEFA